MFYFHSLMAALLVRANGFVYSGHFVLFWLCFDCFWKLVHCTIRQKQSKTVKRQSKQHKNDHWCTTRHMSTQKVCVRIRRPNTQPFARTNSLLVIKNNNMARGSQGFVSQSSRNSGTQVFFRITIFCRVRAWEQKVCGRGLKICQISSLFGPPCSHGAVV